MRTFIFFFIVTLLFQSCISKKYILKNNYLYAIEDNSRINNGEMPDSILQFKVKQSFKAKIKDENEDYLIVDLDTNNYKTYLDAPVKKAPKEEDSIKSYQESSLYFEKNTIFENALKRSSLQFIDSKPVLQAFSIPLKIRPKLSDLILEEAITKPDLGLGAGWKLNYNIFKPKKDAFGSRIRTFSLSSGVFVGPGSTLIDKTTTKPEVGYKRNAVIIQKGIFLSLGYNKINLGGVIGIDNVTGPGRDEWIYRRKEWFGVIFSYDLIK